MFAYVSQADSFYACDSYDPITGVCSVWELIPAPALLPVLSTADANAIAIAMIQIMVIAWCFRFLGSVIDDYNRGL